MTRDEKIKKISSWVRFGDDVECAIGDTIDMVEDHLHHMKTHPIKEYDGITDEFDCKPIINTFDRISLAQQITAMIIR